MPSPSTSSGIQQGLTLPRGFAVKVIVISGSSISLVISYVDTLFALRSNKSAAGTAICNRLFMSISLN